MTVVAITVPPAQLQIDFALAPEQMREFSGRLFLAAN